jgi:hypothetical protein
MRQLGARSESAELMEYGKRQQMLPTLMEVTTENNFTYFVDFILLHASIVMTYAATCCESIITLQDMLLFPAVDGRLQYNLKKASNLKVRTMLKVSSKVHEMRRVKSCMFHYFLQLLLCN